MIAILAELQQRTTEITRRRSKEPLRSRRGGEASCCDLWGERSVQLPCDRGRMGKVLIAECLKLVNPVTWLLIEEDAVVTIELRTWTGHYTGEIPVFFTLFCCGHRKV
ncbi:hypothetical protein Droror1_Dr00014549 [Drosera rotundifolia]